jgi:putative membrane protein insertion efficiency factor
MRRVLLFIIKGYQWAISPLFPPTCRFYPSCSSYAHEAIQQHGIFRGTWLAAKRVLRCNPWNDGGYDPVPHTTKCASVHHHSKV